VALLFIFRFRLRISEKKELGNKTIILLFWKKFLGFVSDHRSPNGNDVFWQKIYAREALLWRHRDIQRTRKIAVKGRKRVGTPFL